MEEELSWFWFPAHFLVEIDFEVLETERLSWSNINVVNVVNGCHNEDTFGSYLVNFSAGQDTIHCSS